MKLLIALTVGLIPHAAHAGFRVCNDSDANVSIALGYKASDLWTSEGWWSVEAGSCKLLLADDLNRRFYYWTARSVSADFGDGDYDFCTGPSPFTISDDKDCTERGFESSRFHQVEANYPRFTLVLSQDMAKPQPDAPTVVPDTVPEGTADPKTATISGITEGITDPAAAAPGTHGEPFSVIGMLSHCQVNDASTQCEVHANGWRYVAASTDPTAPAILDWLFELPENTPIAISGDMIDHGGTVATVTIRSAARGPADPFAETRSALQGLWTSVDDTAYQILIAGSVAEELYDSTYTGPSMLDVSATCDTDPTIPANSGTYIILRPYESQDDTRCMDLMTLSDSELMLFPLGVMKPLHFTRTP